jgi:hypothetical protein
MKKTIKKAQVGVKKKTTPVYRDEMGNPRTKKQQKQWEKDELNMIDYKGRPADSYPGGKGKTSSTKTDSTKTVSKSAVVKKKMKSGGALGMKSVKAGYDKNPSVTRADIIVAGKKQAKKGAKIGAKKKMMGGGKCKYGCK